MSKTKTEEYLPVRLLPDEVAGFADQLTDKLLERSAAEEEHKQAAASHRKQDKDLEAQIRNLVTIVRDREERRLVEIDEVYDVHRAIVTTIRLDTHGEVRTRPMSHQELLQAKQGRLFDDVGERVEDVTREAVKRGSPKNRDDGEATA